MTQAMQTHINTPDVQLPRVAQLSLYQTDQIRLFLFPAEVENAIRTAIKDSWEPGIRREKDNNKSTSHDLTLSGRPWASYKLEKASAARNLVQRILEVAATKGWLATLGTRSRMSYSEIASIWFEHHPPSSESQTRGLEWLSATYFFSGYMHVEGETDLKTEFFTLMDADHDNSTRRATLNLPSGQHRRPKDRAAHKLIMARVYQSLVALGYANILSVSFERPGRCTETLYCYRARKSTPRTAAFAESPSGLENSRSADGNGQGSRYDQNGRLLNGYGRSKHEIGNGNGNGNGQSGYSKHGDGQHGNGQVASVRNAHDDQTSECPAEQVDTDSEQDSDSGPGPALDWGDEDNPFSNRYTIEPRSAV